MPVGVISHRSPSRGMPLLRAASWSSSRVIIGGHSMPLYVDIHELGGFTLEQVAKAHTADVAVQAKHGVEYVKYWCNEKSGKVFCMCTAPNAEAAQAVHI